MISPWKSGWLNPSTMSCTGPIAIFLPLSPDRLAFVGPPLLWAARHGSSRSRPLLRQDPAVPAVAHHPPGVVHVAGLRQLPSEPDASPESDEAPAPRTGHDEPNAM